jgi:hypothetical protein
LKPFKQGAGDTKVVMGKRNDCIVIAGKVMNSIKIMASNCL